MKMKFRKKESIEEKDLEKKELQEKGKFTGIKIEKPTLVALRGIIFFVVFSILVYFVYYIALFFIAYPLAYFIARQEIFFWGLRIGLFLVPIMAFLIIYYRLAKRNRWWTIIHEATAKAVVRGGADPVFLIRFQGYTLDKEGNVVDLKEGEKEKKHLLGGLYCYSLLHPLVDIYVYWFKWTGVTEDGEKDPHPRERMDYITLKQDAYYAELVDAEDENGLPITAKMFFTLRVVNPRKAMFWVESWLEQIFNRSLPAARGVLSTNSYANWLKKQRDIGNTILKKLKTPRIKKLEDSGLWKEYIDSYGIEIIAIEIKEIDPPEKYREATIKPYLAEQDRQERVIKAKGTKESTILEAKGQSEAYEMKYSVLEKSKDRLLIRMLEAIEASPEKGAKWILSVPGLAQGLSGISKNIPRGISKNEVLEYLPILIEELRGEKKETEKKKKTEKKSEEEEYVVEEDVAEEDDESKK